MLRRNAFHVFSYILAATTLVASTSPSLDPNDYAPEDIISRDVAIIGGGSSGVYTGVRLGDYNKSVVIIEREDYIGGHAQTYVDPVTNIPIDIGVVAFEHTSQVTNYFERFNVSLSAVGLSEGGTPFYVDFSTGKAVNVTQPTQTDVVSALQMYREQLGKYPGIATGFNLTYPVASDLLLPFGDFIVKYNLSAIMPIIIELNEGYVPILNISTIYQLKLFESNLVQAVLQPDLQTTTKHDISLLYQAITEYLGDNVLLDSTVLAMNRSSELVSTVVNTPQGQKLILSKKLVSAIPPELNNLGGFDLSQNEEFLFSKWTSNAYYTGLLKNTGLSPAISYQNADPSAPYSQPDLPGLYNFNTVPEANLTHVYYGSAQQLPESQVQSDILATLKRVQNGLGIKPPGQAAEYVIFESHTPFNLMVSNEDIQNGFYEQLNALQGQRNTFYNGAAFATQDSSVIWAFTEETVLPAILNSF